MHRGVYACGELDLSSPSAGGHGTFSHGLSTGPAGNLSLSSKLPCAGPGEGSAARGNPVHFPGASEPRGGPSRGPWLAWHTAMSVNSSTAQLAAGFRVHDFVVVGPLPRAWFSFGAGYTVRDDRGVPGVMVVVNEHCRARRVPDETLDNAPEAFEAGEFGVVAMTRQDICYFLYRDRVPEGSYLPQASLGTTALILSWLRVLAPYRALDRRYSGMRVVVDLRDMLRESGELWIPNLGISKRGDRPIQSMPRELAMALHRSLRGRASENLSARIGALADLPWLDMSRLQQFLLAELPRSRRIVEGLRSVLLSMSGPRVPWLGPQAESWPRMLQAAIRPLEHPFLLLWLIWGWAAYMIGAIQSVPTATGAGLISGLLLAYLVGGRIRRSG